ncbi:MAG: site-specific integrase [Lachnospiraceae bacterium]|nr:site-specific integrase [Lachnospiraceae bacterium]
MPKRGINIYKRKDGRWEGRIKKEDAEYAVGCASRKYISVYGKTYTEVKSKMEKMKRSRKVGGKNRHTLEETMNIWLKERSSRWKQTTYATYCQMANKYIIPLLGNVQIDCVDEQMIEQFLSEIDKAKHGSPLSDSYLRNICAVMLRAMSYVRKKYHYDMDIPENLITPVRQSQIILPKKQDMAVLEKYLLENSENDTCLGILTAFYTGIRIGEVCALTWDDVNLSDEVIYVRKNLQRVKSDDTKDGNTQILIQTPKTSTSFRIIPIPPILLCHLKEHKKGDGQYIIKGKKKPWTEPRTLQYRFAQILQKCRIDNFNFHMLRHAFATQCVEQGFDVKSLSEILGHSSIQVTLNLYVHSNMQRKKQLMEKFDISIYQSYISVV